MRLRDFVLRRIILAIPVVFGVLTITWFLSYVVGDPLAMYVTERTPDSAIPGIIRARGLDQPPVVQIRSTSSCSVLSLFDCIIPR
ncbi:MAG: hypothetical protein ACXACT_16500 [Candidatus Thorarchaeota archaeon]